LISITIITKNEERNLRRLLPILRAYASRPDALVSEILVLDSGSVDGTESVARAHGAVWHAYPWEGYGLQKRRAAALARNEWILNLDADEVPEDDFWRGLEAFFASGEHELHKAATLARDFVLFGRRLRHGGASEQRRLRLYNKTSFEWNEAGVHEDVVALPGRSTPVGRIGGRVLHFSWASTTDWLRVTDERAAVLARAKLNAGSSGARMGAQALPRFVLEFARGYILRLGFLDGVPGFVFCFFMAFSHALKLVKAYEMMTNGET
jgi:glycosyltransferase involved in cell wall biosynthesis